MDAMSNTASLPQTDAVSEPEWTLGERIHKCRKLMHLEQEPFGKLVGVSYSLVSKWENDIREPKLSQLRLIEDLAPVPKGFLIRSRCTSMGDLRVIPGGKLSPVRSGQMIPMPLPLFAQVTDN